MSGDNRQIVADCLTIYMAKTYRHGKNMMRNATNFP